MKERTSLFATVIASFAFLAAGCGGGGGGSSSSGGGDGNLTLAYEVEGFTGTLVNDVTESQTPQTVQINVGGSVRSVTNVIVVSSLNQGNRVRVVNEGSKLLNITIANPGQGAAVGSSGIKIPITSNGTIQASILGHQFTLTTPPGTWQGHSFPNGLGFTFFATLGGVNDGDMRLEVNADIDLPNAIGITNTGTSVVSYTSANGLGTQAGFGASNNSTISFSGGGGPVTDGTFTATWSTFRAATTPLVFTAPEITVAF